MEDEFDADGLGCFRGIIGCLMILGVLVLFVATGVYAVSELVEWMQWN